MKIVSKNGLQQITFKNRHGRDTHCNIDYLIKLRNWRHFATHMIGYCSGKQPTTISCWISRINSTLTPTLEITDLKAFPATSEKWQLLIKNLYATTLTTPTIKANIKTRVAIWNSNIRPFLEYLQLRDFIPVDVLVPKMKKSTQCQSGSSFNVTLIGEKKPQKQESHDCSKKLITPVSLSRTDAEYLDELFYNLEVKRNKLHDVLINYWFTIKSHFDFTNKLINKVDLSLYHERLASSCLNNVYKNLDGLPPRHNHFTGEKSKESLAYFLYSIKARKKPFTLHVCANNEGMPNKSSLYKNKEYYFSLLPKLKIENHEKITLTTRLNWCAGLLTPKCISFLIALLIMENPSFNYESLLFADIKDKDNKYLFEQGEISQSFTITKERAKAFKKSNLSKVSVDIISHLIYVNNYFSAAIPNALKNKLCLCIGNLNSLTIPNPKNITNYLSGNWSDNRVDCRSIYQLFPSLKEYDLVKGTVSHKKIRASEGVLEFFRTGSIKAVSRKMGNSKKVVLEHYLPKPLLAGYNTRQIRRFQNLLIVAATKKEDYLLEATDFNNLSELNKFISDMLSMDAKGANPLLNVITKGESTKPNNGELITNISEKSLTLLHAYRLTAEKNHIKSSVLLKKDAISDLSPMSLIKLSKHIDQVLLNHHNPIYVTTNHQAKKQAEILSHEINWGELMLNVSKVI